jgi:hypothetical protein
MLTARSEHLRLRERNAAAALNWRQNFRRRLDPDRNYPPRLDVESCVPQSQHETKDRHFDRLP